MCLQVSSFMSVLSFQVGHKSQQDKIRRMADDVSVLGSSSFLDLL